MAALYAAVCSSAIDDRVYDSWNIFFHADGIRVLSDMTDRHYDQWRTNAHPLFSALTYPLMHALMGVGLDKVDAAQVLLVTCAAATTGLLFLAMRGLDIPAIAAALFACVFLTSATFVHWFAYVETYAFAMLSLVIMLFVLTVSSSRPLWPWIAAATGTLAITVTNWGLALAACFFRMCFRRFLKTTLYTFLLVAALAWAQKLFFPNAKVFFNPHNLRSDVSFSQVWMERHGYAVWTPIENVRSVLLSSAVAPPPAKDISKTPVGVFVIVSNLTTPLTKMSTYGMLAAAGWAFMLSVGLWGAIRSIPHRAVAVPIGTYVLFQTLLHSVYGEVIFLYAGNFFPALLFMTAFGYFTSLRNMVLGAAVIVVVFGGVNNQIKFQQAAILSGEIAAHLQATGTAICVPTCSTAPQSTAK